MKVFKDFAFMISFTNHNVAIYISKSSNNMTSPYIFYLYADIIETTYTSISVTYSLKRSDTSQVAN